MKDIEKFKEKLRKNFTSTITSPQFKIPPATKTAAMLEWMVISIVFDSTVEELKNNKNK